MASIRFRQLWKVLVIVLTWVAILISAGLSDVLAKSNDASADDNGLRPGQSGVLRTDRGIISDDVNLYTGGSPSPCH